MDYTDARFEVYVAVKIQIEVFWVVTPCHVVVGYRPFVYIFRQRQHGPPKRWYPTTTLHRVTTW